MTTVHVMKGLPASGKTTFARSIRALRFNLDDYRAMMGDPNDWNRDREDVAVEAMCRSSLAAVEAGFDVCYDNTHLVPRLPNRYRKLLAAHDVTFEVHDFTGVDLEECIRRDAARPRPVGEEVIRRMDKSMRAARKSGWRLTAEMMNDRVPVRPYVADPSLPSAVMCDIDGTLGLHGGLRGPYEMERCETDLVNGPVAGALTVFADRGDRVILLSGRQEEVRPHTERWLAAHGIRYDELWMRAVGDRRGDDVVKAELFDAHVRNRYAVRHVWDDRDRVVALWRRIGLSCWQVNYGNF